MNLVNQLQFHVFQVFQKLCSKIWCVIMCFTKWRTGSILACKRLTRSWCYHLLTMNLFTCEEFQTVFCSLSPSLSEMCCWHQIQNRHKFTKKRTKLMKNNSEYITVGLFLIAHMSKRISKVSHSCLTQQSKFLRNRGCIRTPLAHASVTPLFHRLTRHGPASLHICKSYQAFLNFPLNRAKCSVSHCDIRQLGFTNLKSYFSLHLVSQHVRDKHGSQMAVCFLKLSRCRDINGTLIKDKMLQWLSNDVRPAKKYSVVLNKSFTTHNLTCQLVPCSFELNNNSPCPDGAMRSGIASLTSSLWQQEFITEPKVTHPIYVCA